MPERGKTSARRRDVIDSGTEGQADRAKLAGRRLLLCIARNLQRTGVLRLCEQAEQALLCDCDAREQAKQPAGRHRALRTPNQIP